jgi:formamidopyrimidine-DNA glycosylase
MGDDAPSARAHFIRMASLRRAPIKAVLLDQTAIVGVGNIYADEGLFRAGLHPRSVAGDLSLRRLGALFDAVRGVMGEAIARRGTSMSDYLDINGNPGTFRACLNVYRRTAEPCRSCGRPVVRDVVAGRSTHFCPHCQRVPGKLRERR